MAVEISEIEKRIDLVKAGATEIAMNFGGVQFASMMELMEFAKLMAVSGAAVPYHLRGNPGACLAICTRALRFGFDPFALAEHSYSMKKDVDETRESAGGGRVTVKVQVETIAYDSYVIRAVIEAHAPIVGRLKYVFSGDGDERRCTVSAVARGEKDPLYITSPTLGERKKAIGTSDRGNLKGSPLWITKPDQQLAYDTGRDFCRRFFPETMLGWYDKDEFDEHSDATVVDGKPTVGEKLRSSKKQSGGFEPAKITQQMSEVVPETIVKPKETVAVVVERKEGEANNGTPGSNVPRDDKTLTVEGGGVAGTAERGPDAQPETEDKPVELESPLQRGLRILAGLSKITDIVDLRATIAEELGRDEARGWHRACDERAVVLGTKEKESPK
jgi:hypothetical protein